MTWYTVFWPTFGVRPYVSNDWSDLHGTKGIWNDTMWDPLYDLDYNLYLNLQGQSLKLLYHMIRRFDWHGTKGIWIDGMLDSLYDLDTGPHPWPWPWLFKAKFWNSCISGMGDSDSFELMNIMAVNNGLWKNEYIYIYIYIYIHKTRGIHRLLCCQPGLISKQTRCRYSVLVHTLCTIYKKSSVTMIEL